MLGLSMFIDLFTIKFFCPYPC
uniref:Uncharacterized protein n=1 Tax=Arundo donax TaxID=35708 RepID=A0A0A9CI37_ARUDO